MRDPRIEEIRKLLPQAMTADWVRLGSRLVRLLRDHHHPETHDAILNRLLVQARASAELREARREGVPSPTYPQELPITARKEEIVEAIRAHQVVVVAGETGSGKTTQLPKMCLEAGLGIEAKIGCTQPRRVAALSISRRVSEELNLSWGREVGCKIRFDDRSSQDTYIKFMTDGILLAETQGDPLLSEYNAIIIDEAHERSLNIDFLLGYLKGLLVKRPELKLVVTSATIDTQAFASAFGGAPIIEVSGRVYPVEVAYAPFGAEGQEDSEVTYIDAAVRAAEQVLCEPGQGDILIFLPSERDIRETSDQLQGRFANDAEIVPLFGRLSSGDQQRVFAPSQRRKIVVATNIAETSLTIPGIRYVIDSGLARISRYNPRTRTKRLPIEPISQSSANQRKGRSGRLQDGVCIRLYSAEDFGARPLYTQPEIQRANLAEVILRMKAFRLGEIETFPFINPPTPAAIQGGYKLLQELGALDETRELTQRGRDLARLPIDPTLGRMLLQAQTEHASRELLIVASGLSIQDPRERPADQKDAAAGAHRQFTDPRSDFLTLLNLWQAVHERWDELRTQGQRRKFCKTNFLSYTRMREWQDLHAQLGEALEDLGTLKLNESNAAYEAIHRSILTGLLGHVARRTDRNTYKAAGNREVKVFPGSTLAEKTERPKQPALRRAEPGRPRELKSQQPEWIVAGEIVETSQLFARTLAGIDPLWISDLAPHLCKVTHSNPQWEVAAGQVLIEETTTFYGLEVRRRKVAYGNINPKEATEIFIRAALVEECLVPEPPPAPRERDESKLAASQLLALARTEETKLPARYRFLEHNRQLRHKIEIWQTRSRHHGLGDLDEILVQFYAQRLGDVSSLDELNRFLANVRDPNALFAMEKDLIGDQDLSFDNKSFPDLVCLGGKGVAISYAYQPGEERDGVTLKIDVDLAREVSAASVEWAVPGLREAQVAELLRTLPKALRRELMPLQPKILEITRELKPGERSLKHDVAAFLRQRYGVTVPATVWGADAIPDHLRPRIEVISGEKKTVGSGRDLDQLRKQLESQKVTPVGETAAWARLAEKWECFGLTGWNFGELPVNVTAREEEGAPSGGAGDAVLTGWPGLELEDGRVNLRLYKTPQQHRRASLPGFQRLIEVACQKDLAWLQKDLRAVVGLEPLTRGFCSTEELQVDAFDNLRRSLLPDSLPTTLSEAEFRAAVERARARLPGLATQLLDRLDPILKLRHEIVRRFASAPVPAASQTRTVSDLRQLATPPAAKGSPRLPFIAAELDLLLPKGFLKTIPFERLPQVPRYLKALLTRGEKALMNPLKDQERASQVAPFAAALRQLVGSTTASVETRAQVDEFRWMVEEFKVSVFAQELGTAFPVSAKRLDQHLQRLKEQAA